MFVTQIENNPDAEMRRQRVTETSVDGYHRLRFRSQPRADIYLVATANTGRQALD